MQDPSRPLAEHGSDALDSRLNDLPVIEPIKAANFPCWLMRIISTVVRAEVDRRMEPLGLTQAQWIPVLRLGSGEAQTAADLARSTLQTPGAMTRLVDRLVDKGIIERERSRERRRSQRGNVHELHGVFQPLAVPLQHEPVSENPVPKGDGLRALQVRIPRHDGAGVGFGNGENRADQRFDEPDCFLRFVL